MTRTRDSTQVAKARRLYHLGLSTYAVAAEVHRDPRTVQRWLDGEIRERGRLDVTDERILHLHDQEGLSFAAVAETVGMSKTGVRMRYYALIGRPRPDRPARRR